MTRRDDDLRIRPGRIRDGGSTSKQPTRFVNEVMRAARKSGHTGYRIGAGSTRSGNTSFGRGRFARTAKGLTRTSRRVVVKARVVRHQGKRFRSAPMAKHLGYLQRDGVGQDGRDADLFGSERDDLERDGFATRCEDDRHHFRFIISPEDAGDLEDLRAFTRDLMARAERDLGTTLDWVAVDHWNTDNPHVHILVRGKADDGRDLVISREYISQGFRARAEDLVQLELGPRSEREISNALETQVTAERWTDLDRGLRSLADDHAGIADLRRGTPDPRDPELRRLMIGRAQALEWLGLAEQIAPALWELKPNAEDTLRELGMRGDIIKRMHRAMGADRHRAAGDFAIEGTPTAPILGRLVERGFHDDHAGTGYAIIDGVDGRVHHLRFRDLDATGDTPQGGIVETRLWTGKTDGTAQLSLVGRSDLSLAAQIAADGATWLDRLHLARDRAPLSGAGFGAEVRQALEQRADHLGRRRPRPTARSAGHLCPRSAGHPAQPRTGHHRSRPQHTNRASPPQTDRGRTRRRDVSSTPRSRLGPLRHDRRWPRILARPLDPATRTPSRPDRHGHDDARRRDRLEPRAQARAEPLSRKDITMSRQDTSSATKILWGQIIIVSIVALLFVWAATQWVAFRLGFQPQLGAPLTALFGLPIYRPWQVFTWWYWYDAYAPRVFMEGAAIAGAGGIAAIAVAILLSVLRAREASDVTTYGSARWADLKDITDAGLFADDGVVLGRLDKRYLRHDGPEHVLCFAPTRSGKGVGLVIPSLLTWPGSAIVHDIKGENWQLTSGWRARFGRVLLFDPTNAASAAYNPLLEVRRGEREVRDVQNIADILVDPEGQLERRNHWEKTSHSLLVGAILHVLYAEKDKTLAGVAAFLSDPRRPIATTLTAMMRTAPSR